MLVDETPGLAIRSKEAQLRSICHTREWGEEWFITFVIRGSKKARKFSGTRWLGSENARPVGGILYLTDRRLFFQPHILERVTEEPAWEVPIGNVHLYIEEGGWNPHLPVVRDIAIHYHLEVAETDGSVEDFYLTHLGEPLEQWAQCKGDASGSE
ncbi:MAG: hypothetical protein WBG41_08050 [Acidimicrobiales bacterium]